MATCSPLSTQKPETLGSAKTKENDLMQLGVKWSGRKKIVLTRYSISLSFIYGVSVVVTAPKIKIDFSNSYLGF